MEIKGKIFLPTLKIWLFVFASGMIWESVIRILVFHNTWSAGDSLSYLATNVAFSVFLAIVLGSLHSFLLTMFRYGKHREKLLLLLSPTIAIAVAAFLIGPALSWQIRNGMSLKSMLTVGICSAICLACIVVFRSIPRFRVSELRIRTMLVGLLLPVVLMLSIQGVRSFRFKPKAPVVGAISRVILVSIDTLRYDYVGAYDATNAQTPVIDSIASEGALYKFAISLVGETTPSHISMFTGEYPWVYGVFHNGIPLSPKASTLTQFLRNAGYHTGAFISGLPLKSSFSGLDRGFQTYDDRLAFKDWFQETFHGRIMAKMPFFTRGYFRQAKEVTDPALRWLHQNAGSPFFLFLHYYDPHYPYGKKDRIRYVADPFLIKAKPNELPIQKHLYAKEVESVDTQIGRIKQFLQQRDIYDNTLIIITSDHGESLGEHNYYYDHGDLVYDQLLRVPLLIRCSPLIKPGSVVDRQVSLLDLYRTILSATGMTGSKRANGYNLIELAQRMPADYDPVFPSDSFGAVGLRTQEWKFIRNKKKKTLQYELYNLINDPAEVVNLVNLEKNKAKEMSETMTKIFGSIQANIRHDWKPDELSEEQREELRSLGYTNQ